jgi:hypothetical protein
MRKILFATGISFFGFFLLEQRVAVPQSKVIKTLKCNVSGKAFDSKLSVYPLVAYSGSVNCTLGKPSKIEFFLYHANVNTPNNWKLTG